MAPFEDLRTIPAKVERLVELFSALEAAAAAASLPEERHGIVTLVVEEAFVNLCRHAYRGRDDGTVGLRLAAQEGELLVELRDSGPPFDPIVHAPRPRLDAPLEERKPGGLGVELMRRMTDELRYRRDGAENILTMVFRWPGGGDGGAASGATPDLAR